MTLTEPGSVANRAPVTPGRWTRPRGVRGGRNRKPALVANDDTRTGTS